MHIRSAGPDDVPVVLSLFDDAVEWLVARGSSGQWGDRPWSQVPAKVRRIEEIAQDGMWLAVVGHRVAGALKISEQAPDYAPAAGEREMYVVMLVVSRDLAGRNIGGRLLHFAREQALDRGIGLLRVDCWSGGDGALIGYYTRQGFTPTQRVPVGDSEVQVLEQRI